MNEKKTNNFTVTDFAHAKVKVAQGWLQGYTEEAPNGTLKIFKGIPYAAPPVGELRFRRPQAPGRWRGIRRATQYSAAAVQHVQVFGDEKANVHGVPQMLAPSQYEEDCLYLNVWSPAKTQQDRLPVFIWVHGGGMIKDISHNAGLSTCRAARCFFHALGAAADGTKMPVRGGVCMYLFKKNARAGQSARQQQKNRKPAAKSSKKNRVKSL